MSEMGHLRKNVELTAEDLEPLSTPILEMDAESAERHRIAFEQLDAHPELRCDYVCYGYDGKTCNSFCRGYSQ